MTLDTAAPTTGDSGRDDYSVTRVRDKLGQTLRAYIQAQYHIRDVGLIRERALLLEEAGSVAQKPYLEATRVYKSGGAYNSLNIPQPAKDLLSLLASMQPGVGVFEPPYVHQVRALEAFLGPKGQDLVVATGTGSGKTESFLMPILGQLAIEGANAPDAARRPGVRALLLYPMNALVADQLSRVRRLFGNPQVADELQRRRGRRVRFGMYTSRTPYPGPQNDDKAKYHLRPMFEKFYLQSRGDRSFEENARLRGLLAPSGKWPCKDLAAFYGRSGERWERRLRTQPLDTELLTRQEIQDPATCPDLLITNYSMLEYMLLRPIERSIFATTRTWLEDPRSIFTLVLDEAHTYRGAGGAEVALLIRRLRARLGIPRERFRCILTSASLGEQDDVLRFARNLTGLSEASSHSFYIAEGISEVRSGRSTGNAKVAEALASMDLQAFQEHALGDAGVARAHQAVTQLAAQLDWPAPSDRADLKHYLFNQLTAWGPSEELIALMSGTAIEFTELAKKLFPGVASNTAERATDILLALSTFARSNRDDGGEGRILMPSRLHLFFRGLPAQYACVNTTCSHRRLPSPPSDDGHLLGRLHTKPLLQCLCGSRTYELLTHRSCGTAFLRGYMEGQSGDFLWHEPSGLIGSDQPGTQLCEVQVLVEPPHPDAVSKGEVIEAWLNASTGRLQTNRPDIPGNWLAVHLPALGAQNVDPRRREFHKCPVCRKRWKARSEIMDLVTKGEAPFSNLVKAQVLSQPARSIESASAPNGGRKSLLFSDGRQKAARLARDIPREVEQDSFRQALALAAVERAREGKEPRPTDELYLAFVAVAAKYHLAFFERADQRTLLKHASQFLEYGDLRSAKDDDFLPSPPPQYREQLLRQLCSRFYSLTSTTIGYVGPDNKSVEVLETLLAPLTSRLSEADRKQLAAGIATGWVAHLLQDDLAFDPKVTPTERDNVARYPVSEWGSDGKLPEAIKSILTEEVRFTSAHYAQIEQALRNRICAAPHEGKFRIEPNRIRINIDLNLTWWQCQDCTHLSPVNILGRCVNCSGRRILELNAASDYLRSRKGFWRDSLQEILSGHSRPAHICAEEHTAQLSHRDEGVVHATTERHELRFQDIVLSPDQDEGPIDVLSCTTTMEVGIDIGSLVAVGLRNVPPQRENYQQRAGRAGRRGSAVSTVLTYAQGGPHDNHYYLNPSEIVSGPTRRPIVHTDNPRIAARHVRAFLIQTFFHESLDHGLLPPGGDSARLDSSLGETSAFLLGEAGVGFTLPDFRLWVKTLVLENDDDSVLRTFDWLPKEVAGEKPLTSWIRDETRTFLETLDQIGEELTGGEALPTGSELLLDFLFDRSLLPTYAFPTDLASFLVEGWGERQNQVVEREKPQQSVTQSLSEYAPGRLVVIDKVTYRSGGVAASVPPNVVDRAERLFDDASDYVYCPHCSFVAPPLVPGEPGPEACPLCQLPGELIRRLMITPEVFHPEGAREVSSTDRDQDFSYASSAQFPVPVNGSDLTGWEAYGAHAELTYAQSQPLVVVNRGDEDNVEGFWVCDRCGTASLNDDGNPPARHPHRPYLVQRPPGQQVPACRGQFRQVFLGHQFRSDLMVLRITLDPPFQHNTADKVFRVALEDAMLSLAEALVLGASRTLDIDPSEFNAGHRLWHREDDGRVRFDVYLFDTLAGGAGYSEEAGGNLDQVLIETTNVLLGCTCTASCPDCLRHYGNRIHHERLDRFLAAQLLEFVRSGKSPSNEDIDLQVKKLELLQGMFDLNGFETKRDVILNGHRVPLLIRQGENQVAVGSYSGLLDETSLEFNHPVTVHDGTANTVVKLVNDYQLSRNLPGAYQAVRKVL